MAPHPVGENLLVFNVLDGALECQRVNAKVLAPSGDWIQVQPNGNWKLDVRLLFQTSDDVIIFCYYNGVLKAEEIFSSVLTPVNTFRLIFNHYFGTDLELLKDESYFSTWDRPYEFVRFTDDG